jgi:hypothetical protein
MKTLLFLRFAVLIVLAGHVDAIAQDLPACDFEKWTHLVNDSSSHYRYASLLPRFLQDDSTLSDDDLVLLCHGYTLLPGYAPLAQSMSEDSLYKMNNANAYSSTLASGSAYLTTNPVSIRGHLAMVVASRELGRSEDFRRYQFRLIRLVRAVLSTGSGKSIDSAIAVVNASDEYTLLSYLGLRSSKQSLLYGKKGKVYDKLEVAPLDDSSDKRDIFFDITRPMAAFASEFHSK